MQQRTTHLDTLLGVLRNGAFFERKKAADDLALVSDDTGQIVAALVQAGRMDDDPGVRRAVIQALEGPIHAEYIRSHSQLAAALTGIKERHAAMEVAASEEVGNSSLKSARQFLDGVRLLVLGVISLVTLMLDLPDGLRWLLPAVVGLFIIAFFVRLFFQD